MNPARWKSRSPGLPSLFRVADCGFHGLNVPCPHETREACEAAQAVSIGFLIMGIEQTPPRRLRALTAENNAWRGNPPAQENA